MVPNEKDYEKLELERRGTRPGNASKKPRHGRSLTFPPQAASRQRPGPIADLSSSSGTPNAPRPSFSQLLNLYKELQDVLEIEPEGQKPLTQKQILRNGKTTFFSLPSHIH